MEGFMLDDDHHVIQKGPGIKKVARYRSTRSGSHFIERGLTEKLAVHLYCLLMHTRNVQG
jgi:hypothetical protein